MSQPPSPAHVTLYNSLYLYIIGMFYISFEPPWSDASNGIGAEFTWCTWKKLLSLRWSIFVENVSQFPGNFYYSTQTSQSRHLSYIKRFASSRSIDWIHTRWSQLNCGEIVEKNGVRFSSKSSKSSKSSIGTGTVRLAVIDLVYPRRNFPDIPYPWESVCGCTHRAIGTVSMQNMHRRQLCDVTNWTNST